jgi:3'-phosphoadenosine 5'-phosphosulfate sulfotransferase (PAPS reductase)/FAD synthetase
MPNGKHKKFKTQEGYDNWIKSLSGDPDDGFTQIDPEIRKKFNELPDEKKKTQLAPTFMLYPFEVHEQQAKSFEEKVEDTIDFIKNHLSSFKKPYVATSFGSDSIVLMHLVMRACKELGIEYPDMVLNDTLNTFKEEKQYWADISKEWGIIDKVKLFKPPVDERGNMMTVWSIAKKYGHLPTFRKFKKIKEDGTVMTAKEMGGSGGATPECCDILKKKTLKKYLNSLAKDERYDLQFVGTRAEESSMRKTSVMQRCRTYVFKHFIKYPIRTCTPLSFWTMEDTRKYYVVNNIPFNPAYKAHDQERLGCASCPAHKFWVTRMAKDPSNEGFGMLKQNFKILKETIDAGTEAQSDRLQESVDELKRFLKKKESKTLTGPQIERIEKLIEQYDVTEADKFCNPIKEMNEAEAGLDKWANESNI